MCVCLCLCVFMRVSACACVCYCCALTRQENLNRASRLTSHRDLTQMHHLQSSGTGNQMCTHEIMRSKTRSFTCDPNIETSSLHKNYRTHQVSDYHQCLNFPSLVHHPVMKCRACSCVTASSSDDVRKITKKTNSFTTSKLQSVRQVCSP